MSVGNRIYLKRDLPEKKVVEAFKEIPAANIADVMNRNSAMHPRIKLVSKPKQAIMAGPAFTIKNRGGDNLHLHAALNFCNEGDVIIVSNEGESNRALIGEVMMAYLYHQKKIAGIVIDGPIRDIDELTQWDLPIYCTGTTPGGPYKDGPGEINVPVSCGGISIHPGDIIVGDHDGVITISKNDADVVLQDAREFQKQDQEKLTKAIKGIGNRDWVLEALEKNNVEIIDDVYKN